MTCYSRFLIVAVDTDEAVVANTIIDGTGDVDVVPCAGTSRGGGAPLNRARETLGLPARSHDREDEVLDESGRGRNVADTNGEATWEPREYVAGGVTLSTGVLTCD